MAVRYLRTAQIIPMKGMSYTYYEIEGVNEIKRMLTAIPDVGEIKLYPKSPIKTLFAPERCDEVPDDEFLKLWQDGEARA